MNDQKAPLPGDAEQMDIVDTVEAEDGRKGEVYRRHDGLFDFRVWSSNGTNILSNSSQGYENQADARTSLDSDMGIEPEGQR